MARPRQHTPEALHSQVLEACEMWLTRLPAQKLSLRAIARTIGCAPSTLLKLYGSFNNLLQYVNVETLNQLANCFATPQQMPLEQRLGQMGLIYWRFAQENPNRWQLLFEYPLAESGELNHLQRQSIERLFLQIKQTLQQLSPALDSQQADCLAHTLWGSVHGLVQLGLKKRLGVSSAHSISVEELLKQLQEMALITLKTFCTPLATSQVHR